MEIKGTLEEKTSKSGNKYKVIVLKLTDTYEKMVFLDNAELELLEISNKQKNPFGNK